MNLPTLTNSLPTAQEFATMKELGNMAIKSGFLPTSIKTPEQAVIIMLKGRELGIPPMQAFSSIAVVNGKPTMSAELMLSKIFQAIPGAVVNYTRNDNVECVISAKRPGGKFTTFSFSMEDAKRANLAGKGPWVTYPAAMLRARAISAMARALFPDALSGVVYTPEEMGAIVNDDGEVVEVPQGEPKDVTPQSGSAELPESNQPDLGDFVITFGKKYKNKKLSEIDIHELDEYVQWFEEQVRNQADPHPSSREFLRVAGEYLETRVSNAETGELA